MNSFCVKLHRSRKPELTKKADMTTFVIIKISNLSFRLGRSSSHEESRGRLKQTTNVFIILTEFFELV